MTPASRTVLRASTTSRTLLARAPRRHASFFTPPAHKKRTWKSSALRWGLAIGGVYWYNTSSLFAKEPASEWQTILETAEDNHELPTLDSITAAQRSRKATMSAGPSPAMLDAPSPSTSPENSMIAARAVLDEPAGSSTQTTGSSTADVQAADAQGLEEEAHSQGAFNEETGEINWDCSCLGGMAYGPCGPEFREAFSCFVYSKDEPKGIDCIDKFKHMQDCFRLHPEEYGSELTDGPDDSLETEPETAAQPAPAAYSGSTTPADKVPDANLTATPSASPSNISKDPKPVTKKEPVIDDVSKDDLTTKAWHDASDNKKAKTEN